MKARLIDGSFFLPGGSTEDAAAAWGTDVPYLRAVESPGSRTRPNGKPICVTAETFAETLSRSSVGTARRSQWLGQSVTRGGRRCRYAYGRREAFSAFNSGKAFGLNSTRFTLLYEDGAFSFDVLGYGHRVGMSQYGADAIARLGFDYRAILRFYYRGAELTTLDF